MGQDRGEQPVEILGADGEIDGEAGGPGIARSAEEVVGADVAAKRPAESMLAAAGSDDQHPHGCWALRNASRALAAAFFAASPTLFTTSRASSA